MKILEIEGKQFEVITNMELRVILNAKKVTYQSWRIKGWLPDTPIKTERLIPVNNDRMAAAANEFGEILAYDRYYTKRMVLVIKRWFDMVRSRHKKRMFPTEDDLKLLDEKFQEAVDEFKEEVRGVQIDSKVYAVKILGETLELLRDATNGIADKVDRQAFLYEAFMTASNTFLASIGGQSERKTKKS